MTKQEAKAWIENWYIEGFRDWLKDYAELPGGEYARKYGYLKGQRAPQEDANGIKLYQKYIRCGWYTKDWVNAGFDMNTIYALKEDGFLSYKYYGSTNARMTGTQDFYYISQRTAVKILKEHKAA